MICVIGSWTIPFFLSGSLMSTDSSSLGFLEVFLLFPTSCSTKILTANLVTYSTPLDIWRVLVLLSLESTILETMLSTTVGFPSIITSFSKLSLAYLYPHQVLHFFLSVLISHHLNFRIRMMHIRRGILSNMPLWK